MSSRRANKSKDIKVVDLFCGVGGLTHGLILEGLDVVAGVDNDVSCQFAFEQNNSSKFIYKDVSKFSSKELEKLYGDAPVKVLVGCAPCQPFSAISKSKAIGKDDDRNRWAPLYRFIKLIQDTKPDVVSMENVPDLCNTKKYPVFADFLKSLSVAGYNVSYKVVDVSRYGVPQKRRRMVLLASRLGEISLIPETHDKTNVVTVRETIGHLENLKDGEVHKLDVLHRSSRLSEMNKRRIIATPKNGGSAKSWSDDLMPDCFKRDSGKSYMTTVYGRMRWDDASPTITTHCTTLGAGRYGHPKQNRAISLREAALLQSFPEYYQFDPPEKISMVKTARHIGNAVPVQLGRVIGESIKRHIETHRATARRK